MGKKTAREDQALAIGNLRSAMAVTRRVVVQGPTGFGKTVVMAEICEAARAKDKRVVVTVPAISLIDQTVNAFHEQGIEDIGVIQSNHNMTDYSKPVQIASVQTLMRRGVDTLSADIVLIDEVHVWYRLFERWLAEERWRRIPIIGFSATPWRKGLGAWFDRLIVANTIENMISQGTLAPFRVFAGSHPDLDGCRVTTAGDYAEEDLIDRVIKPKLIADIVESWKQFGEGRPTVAFCVSRAHADQVAKEFAEAGIPSGYMDCETPILERQLIRRRFLNGDIRVVCNVDVIGLGVDWPEVSCISYCRPTRSEMRWVQNIGRGLRICEGKQDLVIIDHSDTTRRLGFVTEVFFDGLDDGKTRIKQEVGVALPKECPACHYLKPPRLAKCPACGFEVEAHAKPVLVERGTLKEIKPEERKKPKDADRFPDNRTTYAMMLGWCRMNNKRDGIAYYRYNDLYGKFPSTMWRKDKPLAPTTELLAWIKTRNRESAKEFYKDKDVDRWPVANGGANGGANGHANGLDSGALGAREQAYVDLMGQRATAAYNSSLMSENDWQDMESFK